MAKKKGNISRYDDHKDAIGLTPIGREIMQNSIQVRIDSKTIILKRSIQR